MNKTIYREIMCKILGWFGADTPVTCVFSISHRGVEQRSGEHPPPPCIHLYSFAAKRRNRVRCSIAKCEITLSFIRKNAIAKRGQ
jgi:hypothetical protein